MGDSRAVTILFIVDVTRCIRFGITPLPSPLFCSKLLRLPCACACQTEQVAGDHGGVAWPEHQRALFARHRRRQQPRPGRRNRVCKLECKFISGTMSCRTWSLVHLMTSINRT